MVYGLILPVGQKTQSEAATDPTFVLYFPLSQSTQEEARVEAVFSLYFPAVHRVHSLRAAYSTL